MSCSRQVYCLPSHTCGICGYPAIPYIATMTTEQLLRHGLEEALADLEFIRDHSEEPGISELADAAALVASLYLDGME